MTTENPVPAEKPTPAATDTAPLTLPEYRALLLSAIGPDLATFRRMEAFDSNTFWRLDIGTVQNLLDEALELIDELTAGSDATAAGTAATDTADTAPGTAT